MDNPEKPATLATQNTRRWQTKQKTQHICGGHHYAQTNTNNVNKTCALIQTNINNVNKTCALIQTNTNNVNKTCALIQTNTNNVNKTWALIQTTEVKDDPNIGFMWKHMVGLVYGCLITLLSNISVFLCGQFNCPFHQTILY